MTTESIAWAAGYFDGEGSVSLILQRGRWPYLVVALSSKDPRGPERMRELFGGAINVDKRSGGCTRWAIQGNPGLICIALLRPYTVQKTHVIDLALAFGVTMAGQGVRVPAGLIEKRIAIRKQILALNKAS